MFEVEFKFKVPENFERLLLAQGWKHFKEVRFTDIYYDSEGYDLTLNEHWLRKRDANWQLKCPAHKTKSQDAIRIDKFDEISNENEIINRLALALNVDTRTSVGKTVQDVVEMLHLKPITEFESFRVEYKLDEVVIDLDQTNFGYELGEIEIMCEDENEMEQATAKILDMAGKLGVDINNSVTGKVGTYLKMNNKFLYDQLISKGILVSENL